MLQSNRAKAAAAGALVLLAAVALSLWLVRGRAPQEAVAGEAAGPATGGDAGPASPARTARRSKASAVSKVDAPADAAGAEQGSVFVAAGWGSTLNELGRSRPEEANPEAPMSFAYGPTGELFVLDQVNGRIVRYDRSGKPVASIPTTQQGPQDLTIAPDGSLLVLDRLADKTVAVYDANGNFKGELPLTGRGIEEPEGITGVFADGKDVYVEREHGDLVKVGDTEGKTDPEQPEVPGRPSKDGKSYLLAWMEPETDRVYVTSLDKATQEHRFTRELRMGLPVNSVRGFESDERGTMYLAVMLDPLAPPAAEGADAAVDETQILRLVCLSPTDGSPTGLKDLPVNVMPEETFRDLQVMPGGGVLYSYRTEQGITMQRYHCE